MPVPDTKDVASWRDVFTTDVVVTLHMAVFTGGADPMTAPPPPLEGVENFVPMVMGSLENAATMHPDIQESHTPEINLTSATTGTGIWAMEDWIVFGFVFEGARELHGGGHYHETYEKRDGNWQIKTLHLTRTILRISADDG